MTPALKTLLIQRHMHGYSEFVTEYKKHAVSLKLRPQPPAKTQYYRWVGGELQRLPHGSHCQVLEHMFPGWTAAQLFGPDDRPAGNIPEPLIMSGLSVASLEGLWATAFRFDGGLRHVDITRISAQKGIHLSAANLAPVPCSEGRANGFCSEIEADLIGRQLVGYWRNTNDSYYFGTVQLAVLPAETILEGYYTGLDNEVRVIASPWRWVRISQGSAHGVDLSKLAMRDFDTAYARIVQHTLADAPMDLREVAEAMR